MFFDQGGLLLQIATVTRAVTRRFAFRRGRGADFLVRVIGLPQYLKQVQIKYSLEPRQYTEQ